MDPRTTRCLAVFILVMGGCLPLRALTINLTFDSSVTSLPNAAQYEAACNYAAQDIGNMFSDNITVNITVVASPGTSVYGLSSGSYYQSYTYAQIRSILAAKATSANDAIALANLPVSAPTNGESIFLFTAQAKALGLAPASSASDGTFTFGSGNTFNLDPNNRTAPGGDFIGVAEHEMTHIMGRTSEADLLYDLFRFSTPGVRSFAIGATDYFSIDGGVTNLKVFDPTGGDPADWAPGTNDPCNYEEIETLENEFSQVDLTAMDVLGYTPIKTSYQASPPFLTTTSGGQLTIISYLGSGGAVIIPSTINGLPVTTIASSAFESCSAITSVTIPSTVTNIETGAFFSCTNLASATFLGNAPTMGNYVFSSAASGFKVNYPNGASGFGSPTWTDSSNYQ